VNDPGGYHRQVVQQLADLMEDGDIIINAATRTTARTSTVPHSAAPRHPLRRRGTSGGVWGLDRGYCLMIGGEDPIVAHLDPLSAASRQGWVRSSGRRVARRSDR